MAQRKKIGLLFVYDESWAGGLYYLLNIINSLNHLPDSEKPALMIFYAKEKILEKLKLIDYPLINFLPLKKRPSVPERILLKFLRILNLSQKYPYKAQYAADIVDYAFPCDYNAHVFLGSLKKVKIVYWIPDFQHKHLPHFFSQKEIIDRDKNITRLANSKKKVVLSSEDSKKDFLRFYKVDPSTEVSVIPFASVLPDFEHVDTSEFYARHKLQGGYFISPNQFWVHKNHIVILKAISLLKNREPSFKVVFTGKEDDYRNPEYFDSLKKFVREHGIENFVIFAGFIERKLQLKLMKDALAVIQPSLFEGWSTVVEDAKAMGQTLILSNLPVHREQCGAHAVYFDPSNEHELAKAMENMLVNKTEFTPVNYRENVLAYARKIISLVS